MAEESVRIFFQYNTQEQTQRELFRKMLLTDVEEKLKLCHEDDEGRFVHANLDVRRDFTPVKPAELTTTESYVLQHFIGIQYHFLVYLKDILQEQMPSLHSCFRWKGGLGQLLELGDAMQYYIEPAGPHATQKCWFESLCTFMQAKCPANLNQELQKKRNRYVPTRFLQELKDSYLNKCQKLE